MVNSFCLIIEAGLYIDVHTSDHTCCKKCKQTRIVHKNLIRISPYKRQELKYVLRTCFTIISTIIVLTTQTDIHTHINNFI